MPVSKFNFRQTFRPRAVGERYTGVQVFATAYDSAGAMWCLFRGLWSCFGGHGFPFEQLHFMPTVAPLDSESLHPMPFMQARKTSFARSHLGLAFVAQALGQHRVLTSD